MFGRKPKEKKLKIEKKTTSVEEAKKQDRQKVENKSNKERVSNIGKVYRGNTKYIDKDTKPKRNYVVVDEKGEKVTVSKIKRIKKFDINKKNADTDLIEINHERYGLPERSGVDREKFSRNRIKNKPLKITDKDVFPEGREEFSLGSHDKHKVLRHTGRINK